jgi:hypothetical protein
MSEVLYDPLDSITHSLIAQDGVHEKTKGIIDQVIGIVQYGRGDGKVVVLDSNPGSLAPSKREVGTVITRMRDRRDRDDEDERRDRKRKRDDDDDYEVITSFRPRAMLAYAIDVTTWQIYVGYSGGASAVYSGQLGNSVGVQRRRGRVNGYVQNVRQVNEFDPLNCAEVAALNVALAHGAAIGNLFFISMHSNGNLRNPCGNCIQWINQYAFGYLHV